jgi:hypothetical protein
MSGARQIIIMMLCLIAPLAVASGWTIGVADRDGLPVINRGGARLVSAHFAFWGKAWSWAPMSAQLRVVGPYQYAFAGRSPALGVELAGGAARIADNSFEWSFDLAAATSAEAIGGGIVFDLDLAAGAEFGEPELLAGNAGWAWGKGAERIEMRFVPAPTIVHFDRGHKNEIRVFFYKDRIAAGRLRHVATLSAPTSFSAAPTQRERFRLDEMSGWPAHTADWAAAAVDLSFLNAGEKPAGIRGFLAAKGDRLEFADGTAARFWGTNLSAHAIFATPKDEVRWQARRLSQLGFNLVRLHHHDSYWLSPNIFGNGNVGDTRTLSSAMFDRIDWWIKCLKDEGIYVWLDLHVQRHFKAGDGIEEFAEVSGGKPGGEPKGFNYVNASIVEAMKRFNEDYLTHGNHYTGLRYKDDAAIAAVLITNENDLTHHYGNSLLPDKKVPRHSAWYMAAAETFAHKHRLPADRVWRSWEHGASKLFLNDLEHRFNAEMIAHLRGIGVKVPIVTTSSWGGNPVSSLPALSDGDIVDVHSYGGAGPLEADPRRVANLLHWIAAAQVVGKPLSVTEWNVEPFPLPERHLLPVYLAAMASHQGWDALMHYAYSQNSLTGPGGASNWETFNDPAYLATMPAAALIFRQSQVRPAITTHVYAPGKEVFFGSAVSAGNSPALRSAAELGRLLVALPATSELGWLRPAALPLAAKTFSDPNARILAADAVEVVSDTGELRRNWADGTFVISSPHTQAALGWIGGKTIALADVEIAVTGGHASVIVQSRNGKPIAQSRDIMITATGVVQPRAVYKQPYLRAPISVAVQVRAPPGLRLRAVENARDIPMTYKDGSYRMKLNQEDGAGHFRLRS